MIYGFVGTYDDLYNKGLRGNGKTLTVTNYLYEDYLEGRLIYTNYYTSFSNVMDTQKIVELIFNSDINKFQNVSIGIDEIQLILNSIGTKGKALKFIMNLIAQSRKRNVDIYYTTQRFLDIHKRLRTQTDMIFEPFKKHYHYEDNNLILDETCIKDNCNKPHIICVYPKRPELFKIIKYIYADKVGNLYDSNQIIIEELSI